MSAREEDRPPEIAPPPGSPAREAETLRRAGDAGPQAPEPLPDEEMGGEAPCQLPRFWDADG